MSRASRSTSCPTRSIPAAGGLAAGGGALRFRNRLGLEPGDLVGLFVGHNFALKGLRPLLRGAGRSRRQRNRAAGRSICWSAAAAIPGPYRRLASRLGLNDTVHFLGFYPDVEECYWSSDFFVQPTYYDPARWSCWKRWRAACP